MLLGATDRAIRLTDRFAGCFTDRRAANLIEHEVRTVVLQRVAGIALGYEDLNDHDTLRADPIMAVLAGKLTSRRSDCAPLAGKSTFNRLEHKPSGALAVSQDQPRPGRHLGAVRRSVSRSAQIGAGADCGGSGFLDRCLS